MTQESTNLPTWGVAYMTLAGLCDAATGLLLVASPEWVMSVLNLTPADPSSIFLRWVGAFVLSVGLVYLYPWLLSAARRRRRFVVVVETTVVIRAVVAAFVSGAVLGGSLEPGWWVVALSDASMALIQVGLLRWGVFGEP
ncbi:MAG: hypothetical protein K8J08_09150 [Thermoanaerobaculia bacterium]|nr:hypothetical protein [Thermoanaerobaculia bacterium]